MEDYKAFDIRHLNNADIVPELLNDFAHCETITKKWVKREGEWELADVSLLREWNAEKRIWVTEYMRRQIESGGITAGAFYDGRLIGFCCVDGAVSGKYAKYANLTMLFVDDNWKRNGIGTLLMRQARAHAIKFGAEKLFISAVPSEQTIAFYLKLGCIDAKEIIEDFIDSDDDRYLELTINEMLEDIDLLRKLTGKETLL